MKSLFTIALMFKVLDSATAPVRRINDTVGATGRELEKASGKSGKLKSGIDRIGAAAAAAAGKMDALNRKTEKFAQAAEKLDGIGRPLAAGGAIGGFAIEKALVKFANLEEAQKGLRTTLMDQAGRVGPEFEKLNALAERLGTDLPGSTKDMLEMFIALREQGVQTNRILGGTGEAAARFAVVMKLPFAAAATHVAKFSEVMGIADKDMNGYMDLLQRLKYASGVAVEELSYTYKYAAGGLKLLNLQGKQHALEFAAIVGMAAKEGIQGETAGSAFSAAASRMAEIGNRLNRGQVKKLVGPILDKHNIHLEFFTDKGDFKGLRPMVAELEKLKALTPKEQMTTLSKLFRGDAGIMAYLAILMKQGVAGYDEMLQRMQKQADMEIKIREIMSGTKMKWDTVSGTAENMVAHLGGLFAKLMNLPGILDKLNALFGRMDSWILLHPKTAGIIAGVVFGVTGLSIVSAALLLTVAGLGAAWPRALEGLTMLGKGAAWTTGRVTALYLAMRRKWVLSRLPDAMFGDVIPGAARAQITLRGLAATLGGRLLSGFRAAAVAARVFGMALISNPIGLLIAALGLLIFTYWNPIKAFFGGLWKGFKEGLTPLKEVWKSFAAAGQIFSPLIGLIKQFLTPLGFTGKTLANVAWWGKAVGYVLAMAFTMPVYALVGLLKMVKMLFANTKQFFSAGFNIAKSIGAGIMAAISHPVEAIKRVVAKVRAFLPFSPAKEGPLRDIHRIRLVETIAETMRPAPMVRAMRAATAATMIAAVPVASLAHSSGSTAAGAGMQIIFSPQITVQSGGNPEHIRGQVNEAMALSFAEFERMMQRYEAQKSRRAF